MACPPYSCFGSEISISSTFNVLPALEFKHCLVFLFSEGKCRQFFCFCLSFSDVPMYLLYIFKKHTKWFKKFENILSCEDFTVVLWKKPCRSFPKVLEHRKWLQHLVADALFRRSKTDYLSVESNQRFRSLSMGTSPCTTLRVEAGIRAPSFGGGCAPSAAPPVPFLSTFN